MKESITRFLKQSGMAFCVELSLSTVIFLILNRISPLPATFVRRMEYGSTLSLVSAITSAAFFFRPCCTWSSLWLRRILYLLATWIEISLLVCLYFPTLFHVDQVLCLFVSLTVLGGGGYAVYDLLWLHKLKKINAKLKENEEKS